MDNRLYQIACNPKLSLTIRYEITRYLQQQKKDTRKQAKNRRDYVRQQLKQIRMNA
jgi:hypothetical protein